MIVKETCHFCTSRCGMLLNMKNGLPSKLAKADCEKACPAGIDIPRYICLVAANRPGEAVAVIRERVPFPGVLGYICPQPCASRCKRAALDEAIAIRALKRFAFEHAPGSWTAEPEGSSSTGRKVAIVGSGACGLTAGYHLTGLGHEVMIFEAQEKAGGHMRKAVKENRLPNDVLEKEIDYIMKWGVRITTRNRIESVTGLLTQGFDAVLVSTGAPKRYENLSIDQPNRHELWTNQKGYIIVDDKIQVTATKGVFAAGEAVTGPALIIKAMADGQKAALSINTYLGGEGQAREKQTYSTAMLKVEMPIRIKGHKNRPPKSNHGLNKTEAIEEAQRCLWCDLVEGDRDHALNKGWTCCRGRAHTARRLYGSGTQ